MTKPKTLRDMLDELPDDRDDVRLSMWAFRYHDMLQEFLADALRSVPHTHHWLPPVVAGTPEVCESCGEERSVPQAERTTEYAVCSYCGGFGWYRLQTSDDGYSRQEQCERCGATGRVRGASPAEPPSAPERPEAGT
jgi:hypothetical protein